MMFLLPSILLSLAIAADKPVCDTKVITRDCAFFKEKSKQEKITLPDGSYYKNPMYVPSGEKSSAPMGFGNGASGVYGNYGSGGISSTDFQKMLDQNLKDQSDILDALEGSGLTNEFKLAYSQVAASASLNPDQPISLPWPPTEKNAARRDVTSKDLETYLTQKLGYSKYENLQKILEPKKAAMQKQMIEQQAAQQQMMAQSEKNSEAQRQESDIKNRRAKRAQELFDYVKNQEVQIVTRGKPESQWSAVEKAMVQKIRELKLTDPNDSAVSAGCIGSPENAFYSSRKGTVSLCSEQLMAADGDLVMTLAHEVGHSIDPCHFQMPKWSVDRDKLKEYLEQDPLISKTDRAEIDEMMAGEQSYYMDPKLVISSDKVLNELTSKGILTKVSDGFSPSQYPFKEEYSCLTSKLGFQDVNQKDISDSIAYMKRAAVLANDKKQSDQVIGRYEKAMKQYPQCFASASHKSQMGEVAGDMMGAVVEEKFISEHPFKSEEEKVGSSVFIVNSCQNKDSKSDDKETASPELISQYAFSRLRDEHPMDDSRLNQITFTMQGLADAYGCKKRTPSCLDHLSLVSRTGKNSGGSSNSESQGGQR